MKIKIILIIVLLGCTYNLLAQNNSKAIGDTIFWYSPLDLGLNDGDLVNSLSNKINSSNTATQSVEDNKPKYSTTASTQINLNDVLVFDGNDFLAIPSSIDINLLAEDSVNSLFTVFKTSSNTDDLQVIFEEGGRHKGMNLYIYDDTLYYSVYNLEAKNYIKYPITANTDYMITVIMSANHNVEKASMYVNGEVVSSIDLDDFGLVAHTGGNALGGINGKTNTHLGEFDGPNNGFIGSIGDMMYFNDSLSRNEVVALETLVGPTYGFESGTYPIELLEFKASIYNEYVKLIWTTSTEQNNDYFTIEHSVNGVYFDEIANINGAGNSNKIISYEFIDNNSQSVSYYRLKQTDYDGKYTYSEIIIVNRSSKDVSIINSNDRLSVIIPDIYIGGSIEIIDLSGRIIEKKDITDDSMSFNNLSTKASGSVFIVKVQNRDSVFIKKIIL